jgi:adenylate cyclase
VFNAVTAVISRHRGTLDKYIGDAVMAFWGAPVDAANHAELCVRAALELNGALVAINNSNRSSGKPTISLACGINSGTMCVGDMGSNVRKAYTVVGDAVNLASRLEGLTRYYGVNIVCGEETRKLAPAFAWREIDRVRVKGKATSVTIYEPLGEAVEEAQKLELRFWNDLLRSYRNREWEAAELALFNLQRTSINPVLLDLYVKRVAVFKRNPPPEHWDGSITFDQK